MDPQNKHTIVDQGCWWTTPLKNCLDAFFCLGFNKASYIFGNWAFVRISKWKKLRKQLIKKSFSKGKGKGNVWKKSLQEAARHNSGPPKQTYYCGSGLLMDYPLEKLFEWCFFLLGFNKASICLLAIGQFWEFQVKGTKEVKENQTFSKGKGKGNVWKNYAPGSSWTQWWTPKTNILLWIRVAHGLPPWKIVWMLFFVGGLIRHHIFLEIAHLWEFQMKEIKNIIN